LRTRGSIFFPVVQMGPRLRKGDEGLNVSASAVIPDSCALRRDDEKEAGIIDSCFE
jgi:hypothetical protein